MIFHWNFLQVATIWLLPMLLLHSRDVAKVTKSNLLKSQNIICVIRHVNISHQSSTVLTHFSFFLLANQLLHPIYLFAQLRLSSVWIVVLFIWLRAGVWRGRKRGYVLVKLFFSYLYEICIAVHPLIYETHRRWEKTTLGSIFSDICKAKLRY